MKVWQLLIVWFFGMVVSICLTGLVIYGAWFGIRAVIDYAKKPATVQQQR